MWKKLDEDPRYHGERNGRAKLSALKVAAIRLLLSEGFTQKQVGDLYGITQGHVSAIKRGVNW